MFPNVKKTIQFNTFSSRLSTFYVENNQNLHNLKIIFFPLYSYVLQRKMSAISQRAKEKVSEQFFKILVLVEYSVGDGNFFRTDFNLKYDNSLSIW